eukprot:TRINITY_DN7762_c0_g1_i10.p1 TRINITY_DN7762_c0_g1~~TRINITY_DN7762_c0_g1_i10.p1  ORF type:complete len:175 (-),score=41.53 TRINITY_DN7762_c0_g1_i10:72-596(-)
MNGNVPFEEAFAARLALIRPTRAQLFDLAASSRLQLTPGIDTLIALLKQRGVQVYLVSGGIRDLIEPLARRLHIESDHIFANELFFDERGDFIAHDTAQPTSRSGGKARVIEHLKEKHGYSRVVMIGDGATDMEAAPPADGFIGFGGVVVREKVRDRAKWFVTSFDELIEPLSN